ncbi:hypothetical protein Tdes44962_MAKER09686 [Teratosphaeria destructans]|uniref:Rhodopsin domain-containing protein n=1 Tax=Teratosphaeria destructans TaxID=418781 RepID=A0A9W7SRZ8_9PEZI|nr:hypothetical protein Tdes44962_MAKER09686 [Teratosphaeria destructans]
MAAAVVAALMAMKTKPDHNRGPQILAVTWTLLAVSTVVLAGRLYSKGVKTRRLYWDDGLMTTALLLGYLHACFITVAEEHGLGRHFVYLTPHERGPTLRWGMASLAPAILSPMFGRIGFCITMLYLTGTDPNVKKWPVWVFIVLQFLVNVAGIILFFTQCGSRLYVIWDPAKEYLYFDVCMDAKIQTNFQYANGAFNTVTDFYLTLLPAILIEHTRLSLRNKIGLACLLCLSVLAMIASIVKTYEARVLSEIIDYTYDLTPYIVWIVFELNVVIIISSIPLLRPLFKRKPRTPEAHVMRNWEISTSNSIFSKIGAKETLSRVDSEEETLTERPTSTPLGGSSYAAIHVTQEVEITYEPSNLPFVHAALVGLVQGEILNPKLVKR